MPLGLSWAKKKDTLWEALYIPQTCRTRLHDYWYTYTKKPSYIPTPNGSTGINLEKEKTNLFFCLSGDNAPLSENNSKTIDLVLTNLKKLNRIEKKYKISPTEGEFVSVVNHKDQPMGFGVVFIGNKDWQSALWKISIYSFLIKSVCCDKFWLNRSKEDIRSYSKLLRDNKEMLLSKIKEDIADVFTEDSFENIHVKSGFVSICTGVNPKMAKLLLTGNKNG